MCWLHVTTLLRLTLMKTFAVLALIAVFEGILYAASSNDIHSVDYKNFRYSPSCMHLTDINELLLANPGRYT